MAIRPIYKGITFDIKPLRDRKLISRAKTVLPAPRLENAVKNAKELRFAFTIGQNTMVLLGLPRKYYENYDLKRVSERIGKSFVIDKAINPFCIKGMKIDWNDNVPVQTRDKISLPAEVYKAIRRWLPDYIFTARKADGSVDDNYYIKLLEDNPSALSTNAVFSFLNKRRAEASALGFEFKGKLAEDLAAIGITRDKVVKLEEVPKLEGGVKIWLSDEHIGGGDKPDDFMWAKGEVKEKLIPWIKDKIAALKEKGIKAYLIIPGDLLEKWQYSDDEIFDAHKDLLEIALDLGIDIYYVYGNHDMEMAALENCMVLGRNGTRIFIVEKIFDDDSVWIHGHQADPFNKRIEEKSKNIKASHEIEKKPFGSYITKLVKYLEYIYPNADEWLDAIRKRMTPATVRKMEVDTYVRFFNDLRKEAQGNNPALDILRVNMGHTHGIELGNKNTDLGKYLRDHRELGLMYFNDGTWAESMQPGSRAIGVKNRAGENEIFPWGTKPSDEYLFA
ncbi:MAG: hypothetical protein NT030_05170 [Candidatus Saganbacteria bacterium]|nr:hypothetical protein [Candidatus Saganbacteria bacterium]